MAYRDEAAALNVSAMLVAVAVPPLCFVALDPSTSWELVVLLLLLALGAVAWLGFAVWRDTYLFLKHASTASFFVLGGCALGWLFQTKPLFETVLTVIVMVALFVGMERCARHEGKVPHVLLFRPDLQPVLEFEGIHLAVTTPRTVSSGSSVPVSLYLENCWSGPREVTLQFPKEYGVTGPQPKAPERLRVTLQAGEVGRADFRVQMPPDAQGKCNLLTQFTVRGLMGRRVRMRRALEFRNKVSMQEQLVYLAAGAFIWGGGLRLRWDVEPARATPEDTWTDAVSWNVLWSPEKPAVQAVLS